MSQICRRKRFVSTDRITDVRGELPFGGDDGTTYIPWLPSTETTGAGAEGAAGSSRLEPDGMCRYSYVYTGMASPRYLYGYLGRRHVTRGSPSDT